MDFEEFVSHISFRHITPDSDIPAIYYKISRSFEALDLSLESYITHLPWMECEIKRKLHPLMKIPRMSTLAIGAIINYGVATMDPGQIFVNIGVWNGFTFLAGMAGNPGKTCIGIDNFSEFDGPRDQFLERFNKMKSENHYFFEMDYEKYFDEGQKGEIGFFIYDGEHSYRNQLKGLQIAEPYLSKNSIILVDDTNWEEPRKATMDFISSSRNHYRILFDKRTHLNGHPTYWNGVILLKKEN